MPDSSTGDEALRGGAEEEVKNLPGDVGESSADTTQDASTSDSSTGEKKDDNKPTNIADAVRAALFKGEEQSSGSGEGEGEDTGEPDDATKEKSKEAEEEDPGDLTDEELKSYKPKTRRRFEKLDRENKAYVAEIKQLKPQAEGFQAVQKYAKDANLSREDVNTGFEIMRLMRNDPVKAWEALEPIVQQLQAMVGNILPADLQSQVTAGKITPEHAKELSRLRAERGISSSVQRETAERTQKENAAQAAEQSLALQNDVALGITKWENDWKASDPDYSLKQSRVNEAIELELNRAVLLAKEGKPNNLPRTVEQAVKLANDVKKRVEKEMRQFLPKRNNAITHVTGNGVNNGSKPLARNMNDVVRMAVGQK